MHQGVKWNSSLLKKWNVYCHGKAGLGFYLQLLFSKCGRKLEAFLLSLSVVLFFLFIFQNNGRSKKCIDAPILSRYVCLTGPRQNNFFHALHIPIHKIKHISWHLYYHQGLSVIYKYRLAVTFFLHVSLTIAKKMWH